MGPGFEVLAAPPASGCAGGEADQGGAPTAPTTRSALSHPAGQGCGSEGRRLGNQTHQVRCPTLPYGHPDPTGVSWDFVQTGPAVCDCGTSHGPLCPG